jgi:predicted FMN-binding regulatory protein PaiB
VGLLVISLVGTLYRGAIRHIAAVRLEIGSRRVKWKLAQNRPIEARTRIIEQLRKRGRRSDERAADALQATIERERAR